MRKNKNLILSMLLLFLAPIAFAATAEHHEDGIPLRIIFWQAVNLSILLIAMFFLMRKSVIASFVEKREKFLSAAKKSQALRESAEKELLEYQAQIQKLRATAEESISRAKAESVAQRQQIIRDAEELSTRLRKEAKEAIEVETRRAERQLREQLITQAMKLARTEIAGEMRSDDHQNLQKSFVENMKAVN